MVTKESKYVDKKKNEHPVFSIYRTAEEAADEKKFPIVSLGLSKAKAILANLDELKAFVDRHGI